MSSSTTFIAVVPAAGVGKRMQADRPKQYLTLLGKTLLEHTLEKLINHPRIHHILLALHTDDPYFNQLPIAKASWLTRVDGGKERADSVLAGLAPITESAWALVHDAARPCVSHQDISRLLALADQGDTGGILASPVRDTMKRATKGSHKILKTESRQDLWHALTPQFFPAKHLKSALCGALEQGIEITDEASAMEWAGHAVNLVPGSASNIKVTNPEDLALAAFYLSNEQ